LKVFPPTGDLLLNSKSYRSMQDFNWLSTHEFKISLYISWMARNQLLAATDFIITLHIAYVYFICISNSQFQQTYCYFTKHISASHFLLNQISYFFPLIICKLESVLSVLHKIPQGCTQRHAVRVLLQQRPCRYCNIHLSNCEKKN